MASDPPQTSAADPLERAADAGPLSELLCFDLYAASRSVTAVYRTLLEPLGLTYPQYLVMVLLWQHGQSTVRDLVDQLQLDYNTVSPLLKRLEARGLLSRQRRTDDERSVAIALTDAGRILQARARHVPDVIGQAVGIDGAAVARLQSILRDITTSATSHAAQSATR